jgi:hypothetical protein
MQNSSCGTPHGSDFFIAPVKYPTGVIDGSRKYFSWPSLLKGNHIWIWNLRFSVLKIVNSWKGSKYCPVKEVVGTSGKLFVSKNSLWCLWDWKQNLSHARDKWFPTYKLQIWEKILCQNHFRMAWAKDHHECVSARVVLLLAFIWM